MRKAIAVPLERGHTAADGRAMVLQMLSGATETRSANAARKQPATDNDDSPEGSDKGSGDDGSDKVDQDDGSRATDNSEDENYG